VHLGIVRLSALGDVALFSGVVPLLQQAHPGARITWMVGAPNDLVLQGLPGLEVEILDKPRGPADYLAIRRRFRDTEFDILLCGNASFRANLLYACLKAKLKIGWGGRRARDGHRWFIDEAIPDTDEHLMDGFLRLASAAGADATQFKGWQLPISEGDRAFAFEHLPGGPWIAVNASASKPERDWPVDRFIELIEEQQRGGFDVVLTGGPGAAEMSAAGSIVTATGCHNLCGKTTPLQLAAIYQRCSALVSPDSGPVHLARAVDTPVVGLYAVARPELSGPYRALEYTVNVYPEAAGKFLHTTTPEWHQRVHNVEAMKLIRVQDVLERLQLATRQR